MFIMERNIRARLQEKSISELNVILEYLIKKSKTDTTYNEKIEWVKEILEYKIEYIFE